MLDLAPIQMVIVALLFVRAGFVRSGLGFGGAALVLLQGDIDGFSKARSGQMQDACPPG